MTEELRVDIDDAARDLAERIGTLRDAGRISRAEAARRLADLSAIRAEAAELVRLAEKEEE